MGGMVAWLQGPALPTWFGDLSSITVVPSLFRPGWPHGDLPASIDLLLGSKACTAAAWLPYLSKMSRLASTGGAHLQSPQQAGLLL